MFLFCLLDVWRCSFVCVFFFCLLACFVLNYNIRFSFSALVFGYFLIFGYQSKSSLENCKFRKPQQEKCRKKDKNNGFCQKTQNNKFYVKLGPRISEKLGQVRGVTKLDRFFLTHNIVSCFAFEKKTLLSAGRTRCLKKMDQLLAHKKARLGEDNSTAYMLYCKNVCAVRSGSGPIWPF